MTSARYCSECGMAYADPHLCTVEIVRFMHVYGQRDARAASDADTPTP